MAKDLAPHGVRANTVCPGMVQTPLNRSVWQAWHDPARRRTGSVTRSGPARKIRAVVPLGRWQTPEAIADMIVFLSSGRAGARDRPDDQRGRRVRDALVSDLQ